MKKMSTPALVALGLLVTASVAALPWRSISLCEGIVPPNDLSFPVREIGTEQAGGLDRASFDAILDRLEAAYSSASSRVRIERRWQDASVNAYASVDKQGQQFIHMFGGLARHPLMTEDAFLLVACHEFGHHYGGAPRRGPASRARWASVEGQSDYFATLKCFHRVHGAADNAAFLKDRAVDPFAETECRRQFADAAKLDLCRRASIAAFELGLFFADVGKEGRAPAFNTPDPHVARELDESHPKAQCRLDTLFQGSLCTVDPAERVSGSDPHAGTCYAAAGHDRGLRPACWYRL